ncbi:hypothetical protein CEE45_01680 [Candidatus Heimdallarchaeota archaeon B3_Heim]|nr:MAG: hypothetical protein CEE45_01680 [Candidatus Heimdallarchaeota archaeon B3_Heim]
MPLLRFTKLIPLVRNHTKTQTMRIPRKVPKNWKTKEKVWDVGDVLHVYVLEKLGEGKITSITKKKLRDITLEDAQKDGFPSIEECQKCLIQMHKCDLDQEFEIVNYDPFWSKQTVMTETEIAGLVFSGWGGGLGDRLQNTDTEVES